MKFNGIPEVLLLAVLSSIVALTGIFLSPLLFISSIIWPVPIIYAVYRHHLKAGTLALAVVFLLVLINLDLISTIILCLQYGVLALIVGLLFKNKVSFGKGLLLSAASAAVLTTFTMAITFIVKDINPFVYAGENAAAINEAMKVYQQAGLINFTNEEQIRSMLETLYYLANILLPGTLIVSSLISTLVTYLLAREVFRRKRIQMPAALPFSNWKLPWQVIWGFILGLALMLSGDQFDIISLSIAGKNLIFVFSFIYLTLGLAVFLQIARKINFPRFFKIIMALFMIFYWPLTLLIILLLGLLDPLINFRHISLGKKDKD